jgi:hypothetical protein
MSDAAIRAALEAQLYTAAGFPDASHRALENQSYQPEPLETWARIAVLFTDAELGTLPASGAVRWRTGFLSVGVDYAVGTGLAATDTLVEAIFAAFPLALTLTVAGHPLTVRRQARGPGFRDRTRWQTVVDIYWLYRGVNPL